MTIYNSENRRKYSLFYILYTTSLLVSTSIIFMSNNLSKLKFNKYLKYHKNFPFWSRRCSLDKVVGNKAKERISKRCFKKTKHAKFSEKRKFLNPWYVHVRQQLYIKNYNKRVIEMHYCEEMGSSKIVLSSEPFAILFGRPLHVQSQQQED